MSALGIHDHPTRKLGLRAPTGAPALKLGSFLRAVPSHPVAVDHLVKPPNAPALGFGLYKNDQYGDCGPTAVANARRLTTAWLGGMEVDPSQSDVEDLYRRSGNPDFDPETDADDNGVVMQTMLEALHKGGIGGIRCAAFASVDLANVEETRAAVAIFGAVLFGVTLQVAQQRQQGVWKYQRSSTWGGHAILGGAYDRRSTLGDLAIISWAERFVMSRTFVSHQVTEAWVVVWPEMLQDHRFLASVDLDQLAAAYKAITGRALA